MQALIILILIVVIVWQYNNSQKNKTESRKRKQPQKSNHKGELTNMEKEDIIYTQIAKAKPSDEVIAKAWELTLLDLGDKKPKYILPERDNKYIFDKSVTDKWTPLERIAASNMLSFYEEVFGEEMNVLEYHYLETKKRLLFKWNKYFENPDYKSVQEFLQLSSADKEKFSYYQKICRSMDGMEDVFNDYDKIEKPWI